MRTLETGQEKIQKIVDKLRHETIEPAQKEAHQIIAAAKKRAEDIILEAEKQAEAHLNQVREQIEQERNVFQSSLQQASKQAVESLKQEIQNKLFNDQLETLMDKSLNDPQLLANLINAIVKGIEKEGVSTDLTVIIPRHVSPEQISKLLLDETKQRLNGKPLELGSFGGGVQVRMVGKRMTVDFTDVAIKELLSRYARKDFRQTIFNS